VVSSQTGTTISTQRQFLAQVEGIDGYWRQVTGQKRVSAVTKEWDGGATSPETLGGPPEWDAITLIRPYRARQHFAALQRMLAGVGRSRLVVHIHDVDENGVVIAGNSRTFPDALLTSVMPPDVDAASGTGATWSLELTPGAST